MLTLACYDVSQFTLEVAGECKAPVQLALAFLMLADNDIQCCVSDHLSLHLQFLINRISHA